MEKNKILDFEKENNKRILKLFLNIVKHLNSQNIYPIIYGSLGLSLLIGEFTEIKDIDMLIASSSDFETCRKVAEEAGFVFDPDHDRELEGHGTFVSFLDMVDIEKLIDNELSTTMMSLEGTSFYNLSLENYLEIYQKGLENKWRKEKKEESDKKIIFLIKEAQRNP